MKRNAFQRFITWSMQHYYGLYAVLPDELYLKIRYWAFFKKKLDLKDPKTFNEKLQWIKLHDRKPEYCKMVDKYEVKEYVSSVIGDQYIIPTLGVWDSFDDIDFDKLPDQFVLKCTHDSGGLVIVQDKSLLDKEKAKAKISSSMKKGYFTFGREWPYKDVKPRIIAEKFMKDASSEELIDYKFMCFNGKFQYVFVCTDRRSDSGLKITIFDRNWEKVPFRRKYPVSSKELQKPETFDEMITLAEKLSEGIPFVRVDFYEINGKVYFGELTFFPDSGFGEFNPPEWDKKLGDMILLPGNV